MVNKHTMTLISTLFAFIEPKCSIANQPDVFTEQVTYTTGDAMLAFSPSYRLGASRAEFNVRFGNVVRDENGAIVGFQSILSRNLVLDSSELANWGSDDSYIFDVIATRFGITVTSTEQGVAEEWL